MMAWMKGASPYLHIEWLQDYAATGGPELLQGEDQPLEGGEIGSVLFGHCL